MQRGKTLIRTVLAVLLTGALLGLASPAPASAAASGYNYMCFGYNGTFKDGSQVVAADWNNDGLWDECFGVSPGRRIWHAWPGSGGWKEMPNNGRADDIYGYQINAEHHHAVLVYVSGSGNIFCSALTPSGWSPWNPSSCRG